MTDWAFDYPEEECVELSNGKTYWIDDDQVSFSMKWKVAKEKYMHIPAIADEVKEYDHFLRRQETEECDDPDEWKEEEEEQWDRDEDGDLLIKITDYGYVDVETDEPMGLTPWVEDEGIKPEDVIG